MHLEENYQLKQVWKENWQNPEFRKRFQWGLLIWVLVLMAFPFFFTLIEQRVGWAPNDWILEQLPSLDLSVPCFLVIWGMFGLFFTGL